jgi:rhomboid protease GluP
VTLAPPAAAPPPPAAVPVRLPTSPVRVTYGLLVLIGLTFGLQLASGYLLGEDYVLDWGAKVNVLIAHGELWRLLTPLFIHASLLHIGFNAYALYALGRQMETFYGPVRFTLLFFLTGLAGSVVSLLLNPLPSVGASGAIFGLIGAEGVLLYRNRRVFGERGRRALQNVIGLIVINLLIGLQGGIDNWAHLGGLLGGLTLGWFIGPVWALTLTPVLDGARTLDDLQPLGGVRWYAVLAFTFGLVVFTGLGILLRQ